MLTGAERVALSPPWPFVPDATSQDLAGATSHQDTCSPADGSVSRSPLLVLPGAGLGRTRCRFALSPCSPAGAMGAVLSPALLLAVRINGKGREVLHLAKGDSVKLGCPYVLEPEDNGPQGLGIEWIQITPERPGPENVVSVTGAGSRRPTGPAGLGWTGWSPGEQAGQERSGRAGKEQAEQAAPGRAGEEQAGSGQHISLPSQHAGVPDPHQPYPVSPLSPRPVPVLP